ncbi:VOC family protein [Paenibacillus typhae]|uniref:VOC family protein n=1 Tax=Paenibacillus typhae TaxID=1174501 RepID=UPI001C8DE9DD|nr:VOC family protein [Paenibacillus typhae]MBY0009723.1 VOC family protein [Paenibacillus typhae]
MEFKTPQINLYVKDLAASRAFYEKLGFKLAFTAEMEGEPVHQEFVLDGFKVGLASRTSANQVHGLNPGTERASELVLWTEDTDSAIRYVLENGGTLQREPHDFLNGLRAGWVRDPDGNPIQLVCRKY